MNPRDEPSVLSGEVDRFSAAGRCTGDVERTTLRLRHKNFSIEATVDLPIGPTQARAMLPVFNAFTDAVVRAAVKNVESEGRLVSCKTGCAACCRQLVPITEPEARAVADLVAAMPETRRGEILGRFAAAHGKLAAAGLLETIQRESSRAIVMEYFHQQIACPFLEAESCSIYADRPMVCREFLVTSDQAFCWNPSPEVISRVGLPGCMTVSVARADAGVPQSEPAQSVAMIMALKWAAENPERPATRSGKELLMDVLGRMTGK